MSQIKITGKELFDSDLYRNIAERTLELCGRKVCYSETALTEDRFYYVFPPLEGVSLLRCIISCINKTPIQQ